MQRMRQAQIFIKSKCLK